MKIIKILVLISFIVSCSSPKIQKCDRSEIAGNLGNEVNSDSNEISIRPFRDGFIFNNGKDFYKLMKGNKLITFLNDLIKGLEFKDPGTPTVFESENSMLLVLSYLDSNLNRNLAAYKISNIKLKPEEINISKLNSDKFEGHPYLAENKLYFTKEVESGLDIYFSEFDSDYNFSSPLPVSFINTENDEAFPYYFSNQILFSRKINSYDIFISDINDKSVTKLNAQYNTEFNELSPVIDKGNIIFSSNRACNNYDLYSTDFCNYSNLELSFSSDAEGVPFEGILIVNNKSSLESNRIEILEPTINIKLEPNSEYSFIYKNNCNLYKEQSFNVNTSCNPQSIVTLKQDLLIPEIDREFTFETYDIPFFVTGYYKPNTSENLEELRRYFKEGIIKKTDSTEYIAYPDDEKYDKYAQVIDEAFDDALSYINQFAIADRNEDCLNKGKYTLDITITGYSDPRKISNNAKYTGPEIYDNEGKLIIRNGESIDNALLAFLRGYFTADYIKRKTQVEVSRLNFNILSGGIDESKEVPNDIKRRVKVDIKVKDNFKNNNKE